ncbi:DPOD2 [Enterospora canceri]|uniref:DPOD2 n=1 Tax=Enterospora canceri TaxID=1081671 RepID=A0A1Y1S991_9MICR|nr:DPOD2 [Enterospora canceri]
MKQNNQHVDFSLQYNENYRMRHRELSELIEYEDAPYSRISDVKNNTRMVKAVLFMNSSKKLSIFNKNVEIDLERTNREIQTYEEEKDGLHFIEDLSCRVEVEFKCNIFNDFLVTGMVLGFVGAMEGAKFVCTKIIYPGALSGRMDDVVSEHRLLIFSNVKFNRNFPNLLTLLDLNRDKYDDVVFIGPIFDRTQDDWDFSKFNRFLDTFPGKLYILPGLDDPTSGFVPQPPLHKLLFSRNKNVVRLTNPATVEINSKTCLFLDGKYAMADLLRYKKHSRATDAMKAVIKSRLILPNAPDTIPCVPESHRDPLLLSKVSLIVSGGTKTEYDIFRQKMLLSVADFDETKVATLFHMKNKQIEEIAFCE